MSLRRLTPLRIGIALGAGLLAMGTQYLSLNPHPFESVTEHALRLSTEYGIIIGYDHPSTFYVAPYEPKDADVAGLKMSRVDSEQLPPALDGVEKALSLYPADFVSHLVRAIFIAGELREGFERAGGSTAPAWIILAAPDNSNETTIRLNCLLGVHHELSSFVLKNAGSIKAWESFVPPGWQFTTTSEAALAHGTDLEPEVATGFLSAYGATTAENDFNIYAERIFTQPRDLVRLACQHALVRAKLLFVLQTYVGLDGRMEDTFRELGIDRTRLCEE